MTTTSTALGGGGKTTNAFHTDAITALDWETFWVVKSGDLGSGFRYAIRPAGASPNFHLTAIGGGFRPPPALAITHFGFLTPESAFTLLRLEDGSYALKCPNGINYVTAVNGGGLANGDNLHTDATRIGAWEKFKIVDLGNATYAIQTLSGFYLGVKNNFFQTTGGISTRIGDPNAAPQIGYTAKFELMMIDP